MAKSFDTITFKYQNKVIDNLGFSITLLLIFIVIGSILSLLMSGFGHSTSFLSNREIFEIVKFTLIQSTISVLISLFLGVFVAKILISIKSRTLKILFLSFSSVAFVIPTVVAGIGIIKVWGGNGLLNYIELIFGFGDKELVVFGLLGILLAHSYQLLRDMLEC